MKIFYRPEQSVKQNRSFSPSAQKPALVAAALEKLYPELEFVSFPAVTAEQLYKVHDPKYVDDVLSMRAPNGFGNKSKSVAAALPFVAGSMVAATLHALRTGDTAVSLSSGAHHACYAHGGGYCTFNFLVLAAVEAHEAGAKRVGIADLDAHRGNGTEDIMHRLGFRFIETYSFGDDAMKHIARGTAEWLAMFTARMQDLAHNCDVLVYNAGVDSHKHDPLHTALGLSTDELEQRDRIVFKAARHAGTPVAMSLAGGYQRPLSKVVSLHITTCRVAQEE